MARKVLSAFIIIIVLFNSLVTDIAKAAPSPEESKWSIISKLRGYSDALNNNYSGQYGLYYTLNYITHYARWVDFLHDFEGVHGIGFTEVEKQYYREEFISKVNDFNKRFSGESQNHRPLELTVYEEPERFRLMLEAIIRDEIASYIQEDLNELVDLTEEASLVSNTAYRDIIASNRHRLRYIFRVVNFLANGHLEMSDLVPDGGSLYVTGSDLAVSILGDEKYLALLDEGREINEQELADMDPVGLVTAGEYLERLAYVQRVPDVDGVGANSWLPTPGRYSEGYELQPVYMRMFSAGAVYRPLVSYVGDKEYIEALRSLSGDEADKVIELFNEIKDYKKPLYTIYDGSRWFESLDLIKWMTGREEGVEEQPGSFPTYVGKAKLLTLKDVVDNVENNTLFGLVMQQGEFRRDPDSNAYFYYNSRMKETTLEDGTIVRSSGNDILSSAEEEISSPTWTSTVLESGGRSSDQVTYFAASMTLAVLKNMLRDNDRILNSLGDLNYQYLYMNVFGDVVTKDNLVVLPGVANPKFYNPGSGYVPYSVTFMKHYPNAHTSGNSLKLGQDTNKGKYILISEEPAWGNRAIFLRIKGENNLATTEPYLTYWVDFNLAETVGTETTALNKTDVSAALSGFWNTFKYVWSTDWNYEYSHLFEPTIVEKENLFTSDGIDVFSYSPEEDVNYEVAKYLARNMYLSFKMQDGQILPNFNDKINQDYVFRNVLLEALNGTVYATGYNKSITETYDNISENTYGSFKRLLVGWAQEIVSSFGNVTGVLGIKDSYQDPLFGRILFFTDKFFYYLLMALLLVFIVKFMRDRASLTYTIVSSILCLAVAFASLKIFPIYFPKVYNVAVNNFNTNLSYEIVASKAEKYWDTYARSGMVDENGRFLISTTSLNLYKLDDESLNELERRYKIEREDIGAGKVYVLDSNVGLYLEANSLKQNIDLLFYTNPIYGEYEETPSGLSYQIKADKIHSSSVEYYMPYYQIQEGFLDTLNSLLMVYKIPRHSVQYQTGLSKDSFVVYNYLNSAPFLTPRMYLTTQDDLTPEVADSLYYHFDNPDYQKDSRDFLNLHRMLSNPTIQMQESLWWRSLVQNGYMELDEEGNPTQKYWDLIDSVNLNTKKFLIDLKPQAGLISDENLIKIVSLYATTIFNQKISEYGNWVYPTTLNYQEYNLHDVLLGIVSTDYSKYLLVNRDLVTYVAEESGSFALLMLMVVTLTGNIVSNIIQLSLPIFYISFLLMMLLRFFRGERLRPLLVGYAKVFVLIMTCMTVFVGSLHLVSGWNLNLALLVLAVVFILILYIVFHIVSSVLFNFTEMGNTKLTEKVKSFMQRAKLSGVVDSLRVATTNLIRNQRAIPVDSERSRYRHEVEIEQEIENSVSDLTYLERTSIRRKRKSKGTRYTFDDDEQLRREIEGPDIK